MQYNMTKESVTVYQERVEMSKTIAAATDKKATAAEQTSSRWVALQAPACTVALRA